MPRGSQKFRKCFIFVVLLVFLAFLPPSQEFSFGWGGDGDDADVSDGGNSKSRGDIVVSANSGNLRKISKKNAVPKKFKFHKIERIELEDEDDDDEVNSNINDNDDDDDDNDNDDTNENLGGEEIDDNDDDATNENDDDVNDGDDEDEQKDSQRDRADSMHSNNNDDEEEEFQYKKARRAKKTTKFSNKKVEKPAASKEKSSSFFSGIFSNLFNGDSKESAEVSGERQQSKEDTKKSNGIIDWLMWLGERTGRLRAAIKSAEEDDDNDDDEDKSTATSSGENWIDYFNRWPFNSLFPIGKPPKPIKMPKISSAKTKKKRSGPDDSASHEEAMSQESFDTLLRTLPSFVINPYQVQDMECHQQLQIFQRQLRGHKLWTLQMLDSTGKVANGLLRGNINQFGDFGVCTNIKTIVKVTASQQVRVRGKYCLAHIETQASVAELKVPVHLVHGRGLFNSHLGNPSHFIPRYGVANWGICVPNACSGQAVQQMLQSSLEAYNSTGVEFHVEVNDNDCYVKQSKQLLKIIKKDKKFCATCLYIIGLGLLSLSALLWDYWYLINPIVKGVIVMVKNMLDKLKKNPDDSREEKEEATENETVQEKTEEILEEESPKEQDTLNEEEETETEEDPTSENLSLYHLALEIFKSFSPKRTLNMLLATDSYDVQFPFFHVLKIAATFMLYLCLKFLMIGHMPITNRDQLVRTLDNPMSILIRSPMIYADILLLISGFLSAYQLSIEMEQKSYIQLLKRLALKVSRYLPTVYLLICFQTWVLPYLSSGPLWTNLIGQNSRLCDDQWWRNLLSLQNAIDFEETCSPSTIQLALEVQLYLLGPLIVWLFYTDSDAGFFVYGALHAMSVAARYSRTNKEHLSMTLFHGINVSKFYRTANILYSSPISRATTYLLGIGAGIFQRSNQGVIDLTPQMIPFGWILASVGLFWCLWSPASGMRTDFVYTSSEAASYASWCPLVFGLSLCWFIFMFPKSDNSIIRFLLSSRPILVISRLVFPMQLVMYIVVLYYTAGVKDSDKFHISDLINVQEISLIVLGSIIVSFLIDVPSQNIRRLIVNRIFIERSHHESDEPEPEHEHNDPSEASEEPSEHITSDSPEPTDTIWGSDPEEEEQKYITRRRSSIPDITTTPTSLPTKEEESEEAEDEEEEEEISEAEEVKKRPETPPPLEVKETSPEKQPETRRRRRPLTEDD